MTRRPEAEVPASNEKLVPCPFCGMTSNLEVSAEFEKNRVFPCWTYVVRCGGCAAQGPWRKSRSAAIEDWNRRLSGSTKKIKDVICPECRGKGEYARSGVHFDLEMEFCERCGGHGKVCLKEKV